MMGMPASPTALGHGASAFFMALSAFPTPASPCPSTCGVTRAWVGFVWLGKTQAAFVGVWW